MDVFEAMCKRHLHRHFTDEPVSEEALVQLVRAATLAPMGGRIQVLDGEGGALRATAAPALLPPLRAPGPGFKRCAGELCRGREPPATPRYFYFHKSGRDADRPRTYCKDCERLRRTEPGGPATVALRLVGSWQGATKGAPRWPRRRG